MMNDDVKPILEVFGIKIIVIAAGFCGGVISLAFISNLPLLTRLIAVISGVCCAVFFTPPLLHIWGALGPAEPAVAFILGIGGMAIVGKIHSLWQKADLIQLIRRGNTNNRQD
jgi:hypothetical protein